MIYRKTWNFHFDGVSSMIVTGRFTRAERDVVDSTAHSVDDTDDFV